MHYSGQYGQMHSPEGSALMIPQASNAQANNALSDRACDMARVAGATVAELWFCAGPEAQADVCDTLGYGWHLTGALDPAEAMEAISDGWRNATVSQILSILTILGMLDA